MVSYDSFLQDKEAEMMKKIESFTQHSTDDVMNDVIAKPIADILASGNVTDRLSVENVELVVDNFLSNSELFQSFNQVSQLIAKK